MCNGRKSIDQSRKDNLDEITTVKKGQHWRKGSHGGKTQYEHIPYCDDDDVLCLIQAETQRNGDVVRGYESKNFLVCTHSNGLIKAMSYRKKCNNSKGNWYKLMNDYGFVA